MATTMTLVLPQPRSSVLALRPYGAPHEGRRQYARLDFNENTVGFDDLVGQHSPLTLTAPHLLTAYPEYGDFTEALSGYLGLSTAQLLLTNGSDEALAVIAQTFIDPQRGDQAVISKPTFDMIPHYLNLVGAIVTQVPLLTPTLTYDVSGLLTAITTHQPQMVMLASPDNPTGAVFPIDTLLAWCRQFPQTLFVLDQAYVDYQANADDLALSAVQGGLTPNLLLTRTFSKAWGLAGLRLGYIVGHATVIEWLRRVRSPYSVNALAVEAANALLPQATAVKQQAQATMARKADLIQALTDRGYRTWPQTAQEGGNFFLLGVGPDAQALTDWCAQQGVLLRNRSHTPMLEGLLRVSVGTLTENEALLSCLDTFKASHGLLFDLDDTLVDTSASFDVTVMQLVERYSASPLRHSDLLALRMEGGFNDDWDATLELLKRRGIYHLSYVDIAEAGSQLYHQLAPSAEQLLLDEAIIAQLAKRYTLGLVTGRYQAEYDPIWRDRLAPYFGHIVLRDNPAHLPAKPSPDPLRYALGLMDLQHTDAHQHRYVGNSVDDMVAARQAGMQAVGVLTSQTQSALTQAGATHLLANPADLATWFCL
jgi:histidinol-phosphate aminotransferase